MKVCQREAVQCDMRQPLFQGELKCGVVPRHTCIVGQRSAFVVGMTHIVGLAKTKNGLFGSFCCLKDSLSLLH